MTEKEDDRMASDVSEQSLADTDNESIECFQNYTASEVFIQGLAGLVDQQDVESMIRAQKQILQRFEKTNEMLSNCNTLSTSRLKIANQQFKTYKQILVDIKKDLDYSFKKINVLKTKLQAQFPKSVSAASSKIEVLSEECVADEDRLETEKNEEKSEVDAPNIGTESSSQRSSENVKILDTNSGVNVEADNRAESSAISSTDSA